MDKALTELKRLMGEPASVREPRLEMLKPLHPPCPPGSKWDAKMGQCRPKDGSRGKSAPQPDGKPAPARQLITGGEGVEEGLGSKYSAAHAKEVLKAVQKFGHMVKHDVPAVIANLKKMSGASVQTDLAFYKALRAFVEKHSMYFGG
jgi:hypothetical protein